MAKYKFSGCMAANWELVGKDLVTCWSDSTPGLSKAQIGSLSEKNLGLVWPMSTKIAIPKFFVAVLDLQASSQVKMHKLQGRPAWSFF